MTAEEQLEFEAEIHEHVIPAVAWVKEQPEDKKFSVKIDNLPI